MSISRNATLDRATDDLLEKIRDADKNFNFSELVREAIRERAREMGLFEE